ncbi:MAG: hypothetical protein ABS81_13035 [Pseudonocardia sp. SCN 72-86]|nr:MAG: hypothetical protein ABS81_13035 [Pseudonocardia sp. SCN 72-86]
MPLISARLGWQNWGPPSDRRRAWRRTTAARAGSRTGLRGAGIIGTTVATTAGVATSSGALRGAPITVSPLPCMPSGRVASPLVCRSMSSSVRRCLSIADRTACR